MTAPDLTTIIARVRELDAAATKGPWMAPHARVQAEQVGYVYRAEGMASQVARTMSTTRGMCDAALIAYYRTAAPALADECERLRERERVLEEALRPLATASMVSSVRPVYVIGARFGAPYDQRAAEAMVQAARAALEGK